MKYDQMTKYTTVRLQISLYKILTIVVFESYEITTVVFISLMLKMF